MIYRLILCHEVIKTWTYCYCPLKDRTYIMVWCPNLHSYGTRQSLYFSLRATTSRRPADRIFQLWQGLMCPRDTSPQGLPELSETVDDRVLHITTSRSNNCDAHLSKRLRLVTDQCRQVVSRLLEQGAAGCLLHYLISFIWLGLEMFHRAVWLKEEKK